MKTVFSFFILIIFLGCSVDKQNIDAPIDFGQLNEEIEIETPRSAEPPKPQLAKTKKEFPENIAPRHIIKNANLRLQVENVDESTYKITTLTENYNGYMANMNLTNDNHEINNKITIKLPAANFEPFLNDLSKEAVYVYSKKINTQDVTAEYVDLQSRLKTKKEVKERYSEILRSRTKSLEEVYKAEEMIRKLQEEIEAAEGRMRYLSNQSALSTILVDIYEPKEYEVEPIVYSESFWLKLWEGFENGWASVSSVILFFVNLWPLVFIGIFIFWKRKNIFGRFNKRISDTNNATT